MPTRLGGSTSRLWPALGYESVWFSVAPGDAGVLDEIDTLLAAGVTHVGAVFTGTSEAAPEWVRIVGPAHPELLVDVPDESGPDCVTALGGADEWQPAGLCPGGAGSGRGWRGAVVRESSPDRGARRSRRTGACGR